MEGDSRFGKDMPNGCCVESEEKRAKDRSLRNTGEKWDRVGAVFTNGNMLRAISKVGGHERESSTRETKGGGEST